MSKEDARRHRVVNLLSRMDTKNMTMQQWAVRRLLEWQPGAKRIRLGRCGIGRCRSDLSMSYQLEDTGNMTHVSNGELLEDAAYYCPSCGFSGAGSRPIFRHKNVMVVADDEMKAAQAYIDAIRNRKVSGDKKFFDYHSDDGRGNK